jgi:rhodanese-related sulfurtransferase
MSKKSRRSNYQPQQKPAATHAAPKPFPVWAIVAGAAVVVVAVIAVVLLTRAGGGAATGGTPVAQPLPVEMSVADAKAMRDAGAFILDVREQSEWDEYHVPGAKLIPLGSLESRVSEVPRDKDVVVMCRSGNRSQTGRDVLLKAGFTRVTSMAGGIKTWQAQGFPTVTGR